MKKHWKGVILLNAVLIVLSIAAAIIIPEKLEEKRIEKFLKKD